jgi:pseudouridine-5'-phosphate glycosidase
VNERLDLSAAVSEARRAGKPIVALETSIWCQGLPHPTNVEAYRRVSEAIRETGAEPALLAISGGRVLVGMEEALLGQWCKSRHALKLGMRDLGWALATRQDGATTVSASLAICAAVGIDCFATGGIGGVHLGNPDPNHTAASLDVSADLEALARYPVLCVSSGAKSVLDIEATLERLETMGVPVLGWQTDSFPIFYARHSRFPIAHRVDDLDAVAQAFTAGRALGSQRGMLLAVPVPEKDALDRADVDAWVDEAVHEAFRIGKRGAALTPFLLERLHQRSNGATLKANVALAVNNARMAAQLAVLLAR